jgi:YHS domain-containing protein
MQPRKHKHLSPTERAAIERKRRINLALTGVLLGAVLVLGGCSAMQAQNPPGALRPVNAVAEAGETSLLLKGADVVAYFTEGRHVQGLPAHRSTHEGVTLQFASAAHKALFDADPGRYLPQFGGYCTNGIVYGIPWGGDADSWRLIDGRLYIFGGRASLEAFELDVPRNLALAQRYWADEVQGSNSFLQRARRLMFKVPHYQSGEDLAAAVAKARSAGATKPQ